MDRNCLEKKIQTTDVPAVAKALATAGTSTVWTFRLSVPYSPPFGA
jgi:hypothetical protein